MRYLDLFSGIGGFALGAYWAGWRFEEHYFSEVDPWAVELYQKRFPNAIPLGDIRGIDGKALADTKRIRGNGSRTTDIRQGQLRDDESGISSNDGWLITGGFPCQDISFAGKGAGLAGSRSGLWYEFHRLIDELRPRYVIVENVAALFVRGLDAVLGSLAEIGYDAEWECIRASDVGAPHRRERVWIVSYPQGTGRETRQPDGLGEREPRTVHATRSSDVAYPNEQRLEGRKLLLERAGEQLVGKGGVADTTNRGRSMRGWPPGNGRHAIRGDMQTEGWVASTWTTEPDVGRLAHGVPHRVDRLRGLGNAIVPQIAELIFRQLAGKWVEVGE